MKKNLLALCLFSSLSAHSSPSTVVGIGRYGVYRSLGPEVITKLKNQIKLECEVERNANLLSKIECTKMTDSYNYRICSAVCSEGPSSFIQTDGSKIPNVTK